MDKENANNTRRNFLKFGLLSGITATIGSIGALKVLSDNKKPVLSEAEVTKSGDTVKLLSP